ncbi:MAG: DHH family phosphoesterase [Methylovulum sp.]|uniref:DHH family phosphoesterase n=1 Tax=Methylovulum sp. TaxID=1916980 RepID=UPI00262959CF|nr:DHH family phosphoesterase [Methylovulum sp.]MDD2723870.1 DHH family phosphoesterase [Methylovulum sp.]MDD5125202.1 DHH family phosphoesterase [Methylovulum sp.]
MFIDVFNGDADGICALVQLRLAQPADAKLVTGIKRDIQLLESLSVVANDQITVLDVSLEKNRGALDRILAEGARVFYVDHHQPGEIPVHPHLKTLINTDANVCTSLLVDQHLEGKYRAWAVTAAFGDNLIASAEQAAKPLALSETRLKQLNDLGVCINYNGYGGSLSDLHFAPDVLFRELAPYASPFDFMADNPATYQQLLGGYSDDMAQALKITPEHQTDTIGVYILPDVAWARRISGVFGNELANQTPSRAHAVLSFTDKGDYQISVRAPLTNLTGADELCSAFPTGGGRKSAAGINHLPLGQLSAFITAFAEKYP